MLCLLLRLDWRWRCLGPPDRLRAEYLQVPFRALILVECRDEDGVGVGLRFEALIDGDFATKDVRLRITADECTRPGAGDAITLVVIHFDCNRLQLLAGTARVGLCQVDDDRRRFGDGEKELWIILDGVIVGATTSGVTRPLTAKSRKG